MLSAPPLVRLHPRPPLIQVGLKHTRTHTSGVSISQGSERPRTKYLLLSVGQRPPLLRGHAGRNDVVVSRRVVRDLLSLVRLAEISHISTRAINERKARAGGDGLQDESPRGPGELGRGVPSVGLLAMRSTAPVERAHHLGVDRVKVLHPGLMVRLLLFLMQISIRLQTKTKHTTSSQCRVREDG
jgi:hypothetical protein